MNINDVLPQKKKKKKRRKDTEKKLKRWKYNRKLQNTKKRFSWHLFAEKSFTEKKNMSQYQTKELPLSFINCALEGAPLISKQGEVKKKYVYLFQHNKMYLFLHEQNGFEVSWKVFLNLCSRKWLRPRRILVGYLIPLQLQQLNTLFGDSLVNFKKFFLKTLRTLRRLGSNLFHSITVDGKKGFFGKSYV